MPLTREQIQAELKALEVKENEILAKMLDYKTKNRIEFFTRPNPMQDKLLKAWKDEVFKVFTFTGGNRIGKCATLLTPIDTLKGSVLLGDLYADRKPFDVWAWDGKHKVRALASAPFKKRGNHRCYSLKMAKGPSLELADRHRVLTSLGWIGVDELHKYAPSLRGTNLEPDPTEFQKGVGHLKRTGSGYQDHYSDYHDQCGEQPLQVSGTDRFFSPLQDDVRQPDFSLSGSGASGSKSSSSLSSRYDRPSIQDGLRQTSGRFVELLSHFFDKSSILSGLHNQFVLQPTYGYGRQLQPIYESYRPARLEQVLPFSALCHCLCNRLELLKHSIHAVRLPILEFFSRFLPSDESDLPYNTPFTVIGENQIHNITLIPARQEVYDFEVGKYHNYFAGGICHHNTTIGAILAISTALGFYAWDKEPLFFPHRKARKVRYVGQDWEKQIKAVVIPELEKWWPQGRAVKKKKNNNGVDALWTDVETGSVIEIMSNLQESELHEGWSGDLVIYDEPPKRNIRVANARGLVDNQGRELFCMTLLKEAWVDREVIKAKDSTGRPDITVFNVNGEIYDNIGFGITQEGVDQFAKTLTEDEKDARLRGIPSYMSGLVYPSYNQRKHVIDRFEIPIDWPVDVAMDVHPRENQAVLFIAIAPDGNKYLCNEVWAHGDGTWLGQQVVRCAIQNAYRINRIIIDPLSKSDSNNPNTVYDKVMEVLWKHQYLLETASKDKTSGILLVREHLEGPNKQPSLFIFNDMVRTIFEIEGYMYDKETQKPQDKDDHMMENLYRLLLLGTIWYEVEEEDDEEEDSNNQGRSSIGGY